jgi:flavin reductase (DIM6/NTAB) family NADH-FMN oxidoreductase RutF
MRKKLFNTVKNKPVSQFTAISTIPEKISEKVFLKISENTEAIDISYVHTPLCLNPLLVGILNKNSFDVEKIENFVLNIVRTNSTEYGNQFIQSKLNAKVKLSYFKSINITEDISVELFTVQKSTLLQSTRFQRNRYTLSLYFHYLKSRKRNSISFLNNLAALYSFPRKVILNIIRTSSHFNIFPMDLVCELPEEALVILGLNINNRSVDEIINTKKMLIVEPKHSSKEIVYGFAGNHRKEMIESDFIGKYKYESEKFYFPVPDFTCSYKEICLEKYVQLGSHYLFVCKIVGKKNIAENNPLLYHISTLHYWDLLQQNDFYPIA